MRSVHNQVHCGYGDCLPRALLTVTVTTPVEGVRVVQIAYSGASRLRAGQHVTVLADPHDPRYAEIPGAASPGPVGFVPLVCFAAILASLAAFEMLSMARIILRHRRYRPEDIHWGAASAISRDGR